MQANPKIASPVSDELVDAVLESSRALIALSARSIAAEGTVTLPQFRMMVVLQQSPTSLTGLAHALAVAPSTALRMVDRLVAGGLVTRSVVPNNRRESRLELTAVGKATVKRVLRRRRTDLRAILLHVPLAHRPELARGMAAFATAAETMLSPPAS